MDVACEKCQARFKLPDDKVPKNQVFAIACPKCKEKISIDTRSKDASPPPTAEKKSVAGKGQPGSYDSADRPFDFLEEGAKTALICEPDENLRGKIEAVLKQMEYHCAASKNGREVLKQMRFHIFDLIVLNENFDTPDPDQNNILRYLQKLPMHDRRNMFIALITDRFRTNDDMLTFNKSVNLIVNKENMDQFDKILQRSINEITTFYKVFRESMAKAGKAT